MHLQELCSVKVGSQMMPQPLMPQTNSWSGASRIVEPHLKDSNLFASDYLSQSGDDSRLTKELMCKILTLVSNVDMGVRSIDERLKSFSSEQRDANRIMHEQQGSFARLLQDASVSKHGATQIAQTATTACPSPMPTMDGAVTRYQSRTSSFTTYAQAKSEDEFIDAVFEIDEAAKKIQHKSAALGHHSISKVFAPDNQVDTKVYDVCDFYKTTGIFQSIARSQNFENLTMFLVIVNAMYIGIDEDLNKKANLFDADRFFFISSNFFCLYFTGELLIRFMAFAQKINCLMDGWFLFDLFLVVTMILDTWILMPILKYGSDGGEIRVPTQPLRMIRLFKITRMARLMKVFPELVTLIRSIRKSLRAGSSTAMVIVVLNYVWGILLHMVLRGDDDLNDRLYKQSFMNFESVPKSMWILLMDGTFLLDNAAPLMTQLLFSDDFMQVAGGVAFLLYMFISAQLIMQTLVGMLVEVVAQVNEESKTEMATSLLRQELLQDLLDFSGDDGLVSHDELMKLMSNTKSKALMKKLNINTFLLYELQKMLYGSFHGKDVPVKDVLELMLLCRGDEPVTVDAVARGFNFVCQDLHEIKLMVARPGEGISKVPTYLGATIDCPG